MHYYFLLAAELVSISTYGSQWNQFTADIHNIIFIRFSHINELEFFSLHLPVVQFFCCDLLNRFFHCLHSAKLLIIDKAGDSRVLSVQWIILATRNIKCAALKIQCIKNIELAN